MKEADQEPKQHHCEHEINISNFVSQCYKDRFQIIFFCFLLELHLLIILILFSLLLIGTTHVIRIVFKLFFLFPIGTTPFNHSHFIFFASYWNYTCYKDRFQIIFFCLVLELHNMFSVFSCPKLTLLVG